MLNHTQSCPGPKCRPRAISWTSLQSNMQCVHERQIMCPYLCCWKTTQKQMTSSGNEWVSAELYHQTSHLYNQIVSRQGNPNIYILFLTISAHVFREIVLIPYYFRVISSNNFFGALSFNSYPLIICLIRVIDIGKTLITLHPLVQRNSG